jgi:glycosyltransferase involved in cell wall biosynthesis
VAITRSADVSYDSGTLLRDSDYVIALCEGHRTVLSGEWPPARKKIAVIPPPPNVRVLPDDDGAIRLRGRAKLGVSAQDFVIAFFGYVYPKKGIETLLEAFRVVRQQQHNARLIVVGGTIDLDASVSGRYWDEMQRLCRALGVADRTTWTGSFDASGEDASLYLRAADVCVLPLLNGVQLNNSSFSAIAAHGVPVISTRGAMTDEAFRDGENVLMCPPRDADALARAIVSVMDDDELRARLASGATKLARECLSWEQAVAQTVTLLQSRR